MVEIRRDLLWRSLCSTLCSSSVTEGSLPRPMSKLLSISREGDSINPLGNLGQCSVIHVLREKLLCLGLLLMPTASFPVIGHHQKEPGFFFTHTPPPDIAIYIAEITSKHPLLCAKQSQLPQPFLK